MGEPTPAERSSPLEPPRPDVVAVSMVADPRRALGWAAVLLLATAVICGLMWSTDARSGLQWVDDHFLRLIERLRWTPVVDAAKALAFIGGALVNWTVRIVVLVLLTWRRRWLHLSAFLLAVATSEVLIGTLKAAYDRPRPPRPLMATSGASFPSGHAVAGAVTAVGLVIVLLPPGHTRWVWERRAALYASLMALSRTYLNAHWLSDVVAGGLLGSTLAIGWPALLVRSQAHWTAHRERASP